MAMELTPIGYVRSAIIRRSDAPRQTENAPEARIEILPEYVDCLLLLTPGSEIWIFTWLHQAERTTHQVHPGRDLNNPRTGVFATRSPDRPNPVGLHRTKLLAIENARFLLVDQMEVVDGTPVVDIKPVLHRAVDY